MLLKDLLVDVPGVVETKGDMEVRIDALITDSREKTSGGLFFTSAARALTLTLSWVRRRKTAASPLWWSVFWMRMCLR